MGSNAEIARVQEWIARWYGKSVENCPFSYEDIRHISRGPMREVLVDFLITRFRTADQIKVIRSNAYLTDFRSRVDENFNSGDKSANRDDDKIKELKRKLAEIPEQKMVIVKQIVKAVGRMNESKVQAQKDLVQKLAHFGKLESRVQLISNRAISTRTLLEDACTIMPGSNAGSVASGNGNEASNTETIPPVIAQLKTLYDNATDLFNLYFLQTPGMSFNSNETLSPAEIQALTLTVSRQTTELTQSGLKPNSIEQWARKEQGASIHQMQNMELKFSNVMNPVEELAKEAEALYMKLMKDHVNLYFKNRDMRRFQVEEGGKNRRQIQNMVLSNSNFVPADFLAYVQKAELQKKLLKCREIAKEFKYIDDAYCNGESMDILNAICDGDENRYAKPRNKGDKTFGTSRNTFGGSVSGSSDRNSFYLMKQETMEDLTCALLKSFPESRSKLESTVSLCKTLIMDKFANLLVGDGAVQNSSNIGRMHRSTANDVFELPEVHFKISQQMLPSSSITSSTRERCQNDFLKDVFEMQTALSTARSHSEALFKEKRMSETF